MEKLEAKGNVLGVTQNLESVNINVQNRVKKPEKIQTAVPQTVDMSNIIPQTASLDQVSAKEYLQLNVFPKLEIALNNLLETIEKNGEFEKYVIMLTDREEKEHRELRRRERERLRLIKGDDYVSDHDSEDIKEDEEDDYDEETNSEYDSENQSELQDAGVSDLIDGKSSVIRKKKGASSRISADMEIQHRFNALRFLAMNLKSQNETMKPRTATGNETPRSIKNHLQIVGGATF